MRQNSLWLRLPVLVLLGTVIWTGWMYERLPQIMATHWGFWGETNGWMDKLTGAWLLPLVMILWWALAEVLPAADRRHCQSKAFLGPYWSFSNAVLMAMAAMQWGVFQVNLSADFPFWRWLGWVLVVFTAWLGRILPRVPLNQVMGIRTRRTLRDSSVWRRTHLETAKGLRTVALLGIIFQVALPQPWSLMFILVSFLGILVWGTLSSFLWS